MTAGTVQFAIMRHDSHCPAQETQSMLDCCCQPEIERTTEAGYLASIAQSRQERRAAERAAAKAIRKAQQRSYR